MPKKTTVVKKDYKEVAVQGVNITYLTDVAHITAKAAELGISKGEVLVSIIYTKDGESCRAAQKLNILGKEDYLDLDNARKNKTPIDLTLSTFKDEEGEIRAYFNLVKENTAEEIDALFDEVKTEAPKKKLNAAPANILATLLGNK